MIFLFSCVFILHIASVISDSCTTCTPPDLDKMTCLTLCSDGDTVSSYCIQTAALSYLLKGRLYSTGDQSGKNLKAICSDGASKSGSCKCVKHIPSYMTTMFTSGKVNCNIDVYNCTNIAPKCTTANLKCISTLPSACGTKFKDDVTPTSYPAQSTIVCAPGGTYLVPVSNQPICTSCVITPDQIQSTCYSYRCLFKVDVPVTAINQLGGTQTAGTSTPSSYDVYYCPKDAL